MSDCERTAENVIPPIVMEIAENSVFPHAFTLGAQGGEVVTHGLTKRELFAGMAMAELTTYYTDEFPDTGARKCAEVAVKYADALLNELAK